MMRFYCLFAVVLTGFQVIAQSSYGNTPDIPVIRRVFHENIDASQKAILKLDGIGDDKFAPSQDEELNYRLSYTATKKVDDIQKQIEADTTLDNNNKIKFLRGLNETLVSFVDGYKYRSIKASILPDLVNAYTEGMKIELKNQSIQPVIDKNPMEIGNILIQTVAFSSNPGAASARNSLFLKYCLKHPDQILQSLNKNVDWPFTDSLIVIAAKYDQDELYNYAAAPNRLGNRIQENADPLVKVIARMARSKNGRQYFPFLDNIYKGKITLDEIDKVKDEPFKYYHLLVDTKIDYADRIRLRDTPMAMSTLDNRLAVASEFIINEINGLHESPDAVRFKMLQPLTPQELYYLAVMHEEEIYTSSYTHGVYPLIFKKMKVARGDSLLLSVRFDHFKKWIKMAANYNTLDNFLKSMDKDNAQILMKAFVNGLDKNKGKNSLEDAVDVAGSYASITDKDIRKLILDQVESNLQQAKASNNKKAYNIYDILNTLFLSMDPANHVDVSSALGIPPVYNMPLKYLKDSSGRIIIQQFFYGDKDGREGYSAFVNAFNNSRWKMSSNSKWTTFTSTHGFPVTIYSNKPLDETKNLDAEAQEALSTYLEEKNLSPTVVLHRGHSYYLPSTIEQMPASARVILLGSCGGYQSLDQILRICPDAHIIASKQTGTGSINLPLINGIVNTLNQGKDLEWPTLWKNFSSRFSHNEMFDDYVPPYQNLGAVFIMAYRKLEDREMAE